MGVCYSDGGGNKEDPTECKQNTDRSKAIDGGLATDQSTDAQVNKLLLLGAGDSGKSTVFKQMIDIYGPGFPEEERRNLTQIMYSNVLTAMKTLCEQYPIHGGGLEINEESKKFIENLKDDKLQVTKLDDTIATHVKNLWQTKGIQRTYENAAKFQLSDSSAYFFKRIDEVAQEDYVPNKEDVLRSRVPTTGIVENMFEIDGNVFKMFDVGGQRSERKKWIHCFENVTAVLFVASISAYNQVLYEDDKTRRMDEALVLFNDTCISNWFEKTSIILFLNKRDIFQEKIQKDPLSNYYQNFTGSGYEEGCEFIRGMFEDTAEVDKDIYTHFTCATDTNNVFIVFNSVKDIIIKKGLARAGLL